MRMCGVEIKENEMFICLLEKNEGLISVLECRQSRFQLSKDQSNESVRKFYQTLKKLVEDYKITSFSINERQKRGKFAGSSVGFKIEALLQLIPQTDSVFYTQASLKEQLKRNPLAIDFVATGLNKNQENAFYLAYAAVNA